MSSNDYIKKRKLYKEKNKDKIREYNKKYRQENKKKLLEKQLVRDRYRYLHDPVYKLKHLMRRRLRTSLSARKWTKNRGLKLYLGCSMEELKFHIESQFKEGMTWDNHGKWHIDHIIPLASAKTEEEVYNLCHYTNLQPLWAKDNLRKGIR